MQSMSSKCGKECGGMKCGWRDDFIENLCDLHEVLAAQTDTYTAHTDFNSNRLHSKAMQTRQEEKTTESNKRIGIELFLIA